MTKAPLPVRVLEAARLGLIFLRELWLSSFAVAKAAFARELPSRPAIVAVPIDLRSDLSIAVLANMVTLTPGTCSLHVGEDRRTLYVHALDCADADEVAASILEIFARPLARIEGSAP